MINLRPKFLRSAERTQTHGNTRIASAFISIMLGMLSTGALAAEHLQREDIFGLEYANQPQWSPDGRQIVYSRHFMDHLADRGRANLWLIDVASGQQQALTSGARNDGQAQWSPDGKRLAYVGRDDQDRPQILLRWLDTGREAVLTQLDEAPSGLSWSPDGRWIAFLSFVPKQRKPMISPLQAPPGANWAPAPIEVDRPVFRADGQGFLPEGNEQIFLISADGGQARQLTQGEFPHFGTPQWHADGEHLIFSAQRYSGWEFHPQNSELYQLQLSDLSIKSLTQHYGPDHSPRLSPNGRWLAWLGYDDQHLGYSNHQVYLRDLKQTDGETKVLTADLDRSVDRLSWDQDSQSLVIQYDDHGQGQLARVSLDGKISPLAGDLGGTSLGRPYGGGSFAVGPKHAVVYTQTSPERPADLVWLKDGKTRALTRLNEDVLGHKQLGRVEEIRFNSGFDQREVQGWLVYPPDYQPGRRYPLILEIHGGPFANYGPRFSTEMQLYAAAGYMVLYINPRGSTSYGAEFANLIHHRYPGEDFDDLMSAVDYTITRGLADPEQLYVTGGSGGGVLTAWIIGKTPRFRAAVVAKPVINWTSFVLTADFTPFFHRYWFAAPPWEDQAEYWRRSPLSLVGNVSTPTMVLSGEADHRTPISEAEQYYQALKLRYVESMMVRVPEAPHHIAARPSHLIAKTDYVLAWFNAHPAELAQAPKP